MKRALLGLLIVLAAGTVPSGATFSTYRVNPQAFNAASDFGVHVSMTGPNAPVRGTASVTASATETVGGTITQVEFQRSAPGAGSWTTICTDPSPASGWSCDWVTSGNGTYDLRARATSSSGYSRISATLANRIVDNTAPNVAIDDPAPTTWFGGTIPLRTTTATDSGGSGFAGVTYEYKLSAGTTWATACSSSAGPTYSCNFNTVAAGLTNGSSYDFRATATDGAGNTAQSTVTSKRVDNAAPSGSLTAPLANLRASVLLATSAVTDGHSGVASITVQRSVAGANSWSTACLSTGPTWECTWDTTTVTSQLYDLRLVVRDVVGNEHTGAPVTNRRVDNVLPSVSLALTPASGSITGTLAFDTDAADNESGMKDVQVQYRVATTGTWTNACGLDNAAPYQCSASSAGVPDGLYDFKSIATDNAGNANESIVANRRLENFAPSGADVQTADGGGTPGVIQANDTMTLTYSETMSPSSIIAGWNGVGERDIYVRMTHHNQGDRLLFYNSSNSALIPLAASPGVVLEADYIPNSDATWTAKLTHDDASFTVRLVAKTLGNVNATAPAANTMIWTPANGARDLAGKASSTTTRNETGTPADIEF